MAGTSGFSQFQTVRSRTPYAFGRPKCGGGGSFAVGHLRWIKAGAGRKPTSANGKTFIGVFAGAAALTLFDATPTYAPPTVTDL